MCRAERNDLVILWDHISSLMLKMILEQEEFRGASVITFSFILLGRIDQLLWFFSHLCACAPFWVEFNAQQVFFLVPCSQWDGAKCLIIHLLIPLMNCNNFVPCKFIKFFRIVIKKKLWWLFSITASYWWWLWHPWKNIWIPKRD